MSGACDRIPIEEPEASLCWFVDDLSIQTEGLNSDIVGGQMDRVSRLCLEILEDSLGLVVSRGIAGNKSIALHFKTEKLIRG